MIRISLVLTFFLFACKSANKSDFTYARHQSIGLEAALNEYLIETGKLPSSLQDEGFKTFLVERSFYHESDEAVNGWKLEFEANSDQNKFGLVKNVNGKSYFFPIRSFQFNDTSE